MNLDIQNYLDSGMLEAYVTGSATPDEEREILYFKDKYPEVKSALLKLEIDMEAMARTMAIMPPPGTWDKIEQSIDDIILREKSEPNPFTERREREYGQQQPEAPRYIDVEVQNSYMKVNKAWKWVFAGVFILGKIFLATAIYFYLENRQAQEQIQELKTEIKALK